MAGIKKIRQFIHDILVMMRFAAFGSTIVIVLLGAASASPDLSMREVIALISAAFFFHGFVYISNDLIDLDIDRTQKVRIDSPLVQGNFSSLSMLIFAVIKLGVCFVITLGSQNPGEAIAYLALSIACMSIYNLWGKRANLPLLTDAIQGIGWGAFTLYGAAFVQGHLQPLNWIAFAFFFVYTLIVSGVHANLRDLPNDFDHKVQTTPIVLGVRPDAQDRLLLSRRIITYVVVLQFTLNGLVLLPLSENWFHYDSISLYVSWALSLAVIGYSMFLGVKTLQAVRGDFETMVRTGLLHLLVLLGALIAAFALYLGPELLIVLVTMYILPLFTGNVVPQPNPVQA